MGLRDVLKRLADELPDNVIGEVVDFAEFVQSRKASVNAVLAWHEGLPEDDEVLTVEEETALIHARQEALRGETVSLEQMKRETGTSLPFLLAPKPHG